jgi:hypothetical protein
VPALVALAALVIAPFAVIRLWSHQTPRPIGPPEAASVMPERIWFDPEAGGLGVLAGCLLMVTAAGMLLARHAITGRRPGPRQEGRVGRGVRQPSSPRSGRPA